MTKKLTWRLGKLPSPDEVRELVKDKIITQEEARDILFKEVDEKEASKDELEEEIKFLRKLVEKLSNGNYTKVTEYIYSNPYNWVWYKPYQVWCSAQNSLYANNSTLSTTSTTPQLGGGITTASFSSINTF